METLLTGNTGYLTENFIQEAFPDDHVIIYGECDIKRKKHILKLRELEEDTDITYLEGVEYDRIIYFSYYLTLHGGQDGELERLRKLLKYCVGRKTQFLYVTGPEGGYQETTGKTVLSASAENLCLYYSQISDIDLKILRSFYLYSGTYQQDFFFRMFDSARKEGQIVFSESREQNAYFLCMDDLAELLYRIFDNWIKGQEIFSVRDSFGVTFGQIGDALEKVCPGVEVIYKKDSKGEVLDRETADILRMQYGWFPRISVLEDILELYDAFMEKQDGKETKLDRFRQWAGSHQKLLGILECVLGFLVAELLHRLMGNQVQFRFIDVRLLYIVMIGTIHGMNMGILAAALASVALVLDYLGEGANWMTLFYEPSNWLPFIFYFIAGSICGYVQMRNQKNISFLTKENVLIRDKFYFMRDLYRDASIEKRDLKRQILASKDSFGKIFRITKKLDSVLPQEIFMRTVQVMEEVLENHSILIYSFGKNPFFARLETYSREISKEAPRSLRIEDYQEQIETIRQDGIWVNRRLEKDRPAYMVGVKREGKLVLLVVLQRADYDQMTLYYENLLKILCGLVETSLLRALKYQDALYEEQHLGNALFLQETYFVEKLRLYYSMQEEHRLDYTVLKLDAKEKTIEETEEILSLLVRESDTVCLADNGSLYLLLHQTAKEQAGIVQERLEQAGIRSSILTPEQEMEIREGI